MKRPAIMFYTGDWLRNMRLKACSLAARGLCIEMICLMHQGHPYGHLAILKKDGDKDILQPILPDVLARLVGTSEQQILELLGELEQWGVFGKTSDGTIYSRRMVDDERVRQARASGGSESLNNPNVPRKKAASGKAVRTDLRISSEPSLGGSPSYSLSSSKEHTDFESFLSSWNELRGPLAAVTKLTSGRKNKLRTRISQGLTLQEFRSAVSACSATAFLRGEGGKGWRASFDWLIENDTHVAEVLEGKYGAAPAVQVAPALTALDRVKSEVANACNA